MEPKYNDYNELIGPEENINNKINNINNINEDHENEDNETIDNFDHINNNEHIDINRSQSLLKEYKSDYSELENVRIDLENTLGSELLKKVYRLISDNVY